MGFLLASYSFLFFFFFFCYSCLTRLRARPAGLLRPVSTSPTWRLRGGEARRITCARGVDGRTSRRWSASRRGRGCSIRNSIRVRRDSPGTAGVRLPGLARLHPARCCEGGGRPWAALSGDPGRHPATDRAVWRLFPGERALAAGSKLAAAGAVQGLPARICWLGLRRA